MANSVDSDLDEFRIPNTPRNAADIFRRHINAAMAETTAIADDVTALRHGEELVSRLPTLAYYARTTPTEPFDEGGE
ncbi:hypothetical protein DPMN_146102 [Dreissena polymorpha]|uniref:Uncharacterized protein n=1 Tax=Dreissena polymorpha TaxID=45954 RepID=A0A9D4IZF2_DREPO|nr:hypothetical protein DPMN_146102 [Dreissena polymorpha]